MFGTMKITIKTFGYAVLAAALAGTALTAVSDSAFARGFGGGGFRAGGGGGFHFGGGGGFRSSGGGGRSVAHVRSAGGSRSFARRSTGGTRSVAHSTRSKGSFSRPHFAGSQYKGGHGKPFGGMRTRIGGGFGGHLGHGPKLGTRVAMNQGGFKPHGIPGGKGGLGKGGKVAKGGHPRLPGRLALGGGFVGAGLGDGPDYDVPAVVPAPVYDTPVYTGPAPDYTPTAGGPTIPTGPIVPASLAQGPAPQPVPAAAPAAPEQAAGSFVNVAFQAAVTPKDLETFLKAYNVTIVDGPSPAGVYRIQLSAQPMPEADLAAIVDSMKSQTAFVKDVTVA